MMGQHLLRAQCGLLLEANKQKSLKREQTRYLRFILAPVLIIHAKYRCPISFGSSSVFPQRFGDYIVYGRDGLEGTQRIRESEGKVIVQYPQDSFAPEMPMAVLRENLASGCYPTDKLASQILTRVQISKGIQQKTSYK